MTPIEIATLKHVRTLYDIKKQFPDHNILAVKYDLARRGYISECLRNLTPKGTGVLG